MKLKKEMFAVGLAAIMLVSCGKAERINLAEVYEASKPEFNEWYEKQDKLKLSKFSSEEILVLIQPSMDAINENQIIMSNEYTETGDALDDAITDMAYENTKQYALAMTEIIIKNLEISEDIANKIRNDYEGDDTKWETWNKKEVLDKVTITWSNYDELRKGERFEIAIKVNEESESK